MLEGPKEPEELEEPGDKEDLFCLPHLLLLSSFFFFLFLLPPSSRQGSGCDISNLVLVCSPVTAETRTGMDPSKTPGNDGSSTVKQQPTEEPRNARILSVLLQSMGVEACEPRVVHQLLEFFHSKFTFSLLDL